MGGQGQRQDQAGAGHGQEPATARSLMSGDVGFSSVHGQDCGLACIKDGLAFAVGATPGKVLPRVRQRP